MVQRCIEIASKYSMEIYGYNISTGIWRPGGKRMQDGDIDPIEMLNRILAVNHKTDTSDRRVFLLEHFDLLLENQDPLVLTKLRLINDSSHHLCSVILMGRPYLDLPRIISDIPRINVTSLDRGDIEDILEACERNIPENEKEKLKETLKGLTTLECENLLSLSLATKKRLDLYFINEEKTSLIYQKAGGLIEVCHPEGDLNQVGGLDNLKKWLEKRARFIAQKRRDKSPCLPPPKGLLLTGPPGCGKSFIVSCLAGSWRVNLVKLAPSRLFSSLVGQTEQNLAMALATIKSLAPCILWVDEFEKFFPRIANSGSDGGVLSRVLGLFLDFLQEERDGVFVCATTNDIRDLPREIMRTGRFDAIFFIDLPNKGERGAILNTVLNRYGLAKVIITGSILEATEGFSGAEIEQAVTEMLYGCEGSGKEASSFELLAKVRKVIPLSVTMEEEIASMRKWCFSRVRFASGPDDSGEGERRKVCRILPE